MTLIRSLVRKAIKPADNCKVFNLFWDGGFDLDLTKIGMEMWGVKDTTIRGWEYTSDASPSCVTFVSKKFSTLSNDFEFDLMICNDRLKQFDSARDLARKLHIPVIIIDHCLPGDLSPTDIMVINKARSSAVTIGCDPMISKAWQCDFTAPYGIEVCSIDIFDKPRENDVLMHGSFHQLIPTHKHIITEVTQQTNAKLFGFQEGESNPFTSWLQCHEMFLDSKVYVNLATTDSFPRGLLLAMAHGCAIVSNTPKLIGQTILDDQYNCLTVDNIEEIVPKTKELLQDSELRTKLGKNARETVAEYFPMKLALTKWKELFDTLRGTLYLP